MIPVGKSRRLEHGIHASRLSEIWNEASVNVFNEDLTVLLSELESAVIKKCYVNKTLYDVIFYITLACSKDERAYSALNSFFNTLVNEGAINPSERLPYFLEDLASLLCARNSPCLLLLTNLGISHNAAGLHASVVKEQVPAVQNLISLGIKPSEQTLKHAAETASYTVLNCLIPFLNRDAHLQLCLASRNDSELSKILETLEGLSSEHLLYLLKRRYLMSVAQLLKTGVRFEVESYEPTIAQKRADTRVTRLFLKSVGYCSGGKASEPKACFNFNVLVEAYAQIRSLSFNHLRRAARSNPELYYFLITKKVINAWGLSGSFRNPYTQGPIHTDVGMETAITYLFWLNFFKDYAAHKKCDKMDFVVKAFDEMLLEEYYPAYHKDIFGSLRGIITGDNSHALAWVKFDRFLIYGNRGYELIPASQKMRHGITVLELPANFEITEEVFEWFVYTGDKDEKEAPYLENVKRKLPVKEIVHFDMKAQEADGKCGEIAMKLFTFIFLMAYDLQHNKKILKKDWIRAFDDNQPLYKEITAQSRIATLEGLLNELASWTGSHIGSKYPLEILLQIASKIINNPLKFSHLHRVLSEINRLT